MTNQDEVVEPFDKADDSLPDRGLRRKSAGYNWGVIFLWGTALYIMADGARGARLPEWLISVVLFPNWVTQKMGLAQITAPIARFLLQLLYMPAEYVGFAYPAAAFVFLHGLMFTVAERKPIPVVSSAVSLAGLLLYPACLGGLAFNVYDARARACEVANDPACATTNRHKAELFESNTRQREALANTLRKPNELPQPVVSELPETVAHYLRESCDADLTLPPNWSADQTKFQGVAFHPPGKTNTVFVVTCQDNPFGQAVGPLTCALGNAKPTDVEFRERSSRGRIVKLTSGIDACSLKVTVDTKEQSDALVFSLGDRTYQCVSVDGPASDSRATLLAQLASSIRRRPAPAVATPKLAPLSEQLVAIDAQCGMKFTYPSSWQSEPGKGEDGPSLTLSRPPAIIVSRCVTLPSVMPPLNRLAIPFYTQPLLGKGPTWGEGKLVDLGGVRAVRVDGTLTQDLPEISLAASTVAIVTAVDTLGISIVAEWPKQAPPALSQEVESIISQLEVARP